MADAPDNKRRCNPSSDSDSDNEEAVNFKRTKRAQDSENALKWKPITFSNGHSSNSTTRPVAVVQRLCEKTVENRVAVVKQSVDPSPAKIMAHMGFENGKGLAKFIKPAKITFSVDKFEEKLKSLGIDDSVTDHWPVDFEEEVSWIPPEAPGQMSFDDLLKWPKINTPITKVDDQIAFINANILNEIIACKSLYVDLGEEKYQSVRARANVFERINKGPFICRAAMKMANLDSILGFSLTDPKTQSGNKVVGHNELFYFADVCAGPGGFTEYVLWKKKWEAKGFGLTLKGELDFNTSNFIAAETESFEPYYGPADDGNIYKPQNVAGYVEHVLNCTEKKGVHLMMADGGFSVSKQENIQEILSGQIILSQCVVALSLVRAGGHFVCKLFDVVTPLTVGLIYLMHMSFDLVAIHKPNTSRPANSERYLICKWKREGTEEIMKYLVQMHRLFYALTTCEKPRNKTILEVVPLEILTKEGSPFFKYILESNNLIGKRQIHALKDMIRYVRDQGLTNERQEEARTKSLELWGIPEEIPRPGQLKSTEVMFSAILGNYPRTMAKKSENELSPDTLESLFKSPYDWRFVVVEARKEVKNRGFYMSTGRHMVYRFDGFSWIYVAFSGNQKLELVSNTLVFAEIAEEVRGRKPNQELVETFHIIDGIMLGGVDIRHLHYTQRHEHCVKFAKAMNRSLPGLMPVRVKNPVRMENIADVIDRLENRVIKEYGVGAKLVCPIDHTDERSPVIQPAGLLFLKITKDPWQMALNRRARSKYLFNRITGQATSAVPEEAISNFFWTMHNRVLWSWDKDTNVVLSSIDASDPRMHLMNPQKVHTFSLTNHINQALRTPPQMFTSPERRNHDEQAKQ